MISIWLTPAKEDSAYLQDIVNELASEYRTPVFSPHCSLYSPTDLEAHELDKILEKAGEKVGSLYVTMDKLDHTTNIWKTVFIELEKSLGLADLQHSLVSLIPDPKPYEFLPHISLIYKKMTSEQKEEIIRNLAVRNSYKMDRITAMKTGPDVKHWEKVAEVQFHA